MDRLGAPRKINEKEQRKVRFFGFEHRLRKEEMEEQFNRETDERASNEDLKHTSRGVFVAVDSNLGAVVGAEEGAIDSIPSNDGRIAQAWVIVRGGLRVFSVSWHSEGRTPRNGSGKASRRHQKPVVGEHVSERF